MISRLSLVLSLVLAGALAFSCGTRTHSAEATTQSDDVSNPDTPLASSLRVTVDGSVNVALHVTNHSGKRLELRFPSGQTHDFAILDAQGHELWRWSNGRMFTQSLQTKQLGKGETVTYQDRWDGGALNGDYTVVATLNSTNHPVEAQVQFTAP